MEGTYDDEKGGAIKGKMERKRQLGELERWGVSAEEVGVNW